MRIGPEGIARVGTRAIAVEFVALPAAADGRSGRSLRIGGPQGPLVRGLTAPERRHACALAQACAQPTGRLLLLVRALCRIEAGAPEVRAAAGEDVVDALCLHLSGAALDTGPDDDGWTQLVLQPGESDPLDQVESVESDESGERDVIERLVERLCQQLLALSASPVAHTEPDLEHVATTRPVAVPAPAWAGTGSARQPDATEPSGSPSTPSATPSGKQHRLVLRAASLASAASESRATRTSADRDPREPAQSAGSPCASTSPESSPAVLRRPTPFDPVLPAMHAAPAVARQAGRSAAASTPLPTPLPTRGALAVSARRAETQTGSASVRSSAAARTAARLTPQAPPAHEPDGPWGAQVSASPKTNSPAAYWPAGDSSAAGPRARAGRETASAERFRAAREPFHELADTADLLAEWLDAESDRRGLLP